MYSKHLIDKNEFMKLSRAVSVHVDDTEVIAFVDECENMNIIPAIGFALFKELVETNAQELSDDQKVILEGGEWRSDNCGCKDGAVSKYCKGLKSAVAYFVYAKMLMSDGTLVARSGAMRHNDAYASHIDPAKVKQYNDVTDVAESYLAGVLEFINFKKAGAVKKMRGVRCRVHAVGD